MKNYIGINIKYVMNHNDLSVNDLADQFKELGIKAYTIRKYIKEESTPNIDFIQSFCKKFELNIDDFIKKDLKKHLGVLDVSSIPPENDLQGAAFKKLELHMLKTIEAKDYIIEEQKEMMDVLHRMVKKQEVLLNQNAGNVDNERLEELENLVLKISEQMNFSALADEVKQIIKDKREKSGTIRRIESQE